MRKIAIAIIHGAGIHRQNTDDVANMVAMQARLQTRFLERTDQDALQFELIYWDQNSLLQQHENDLRKTLEDSGINFDPPFGYIRGFSYDRVADLVGYQPVSDPALQAESTYVVVHRSIAASLANLSRDAVSHAPLCIIAH